MADVLKQSKDHHHGVKYVPVPIFCVKPFPEGRHAKNQLQCEEHGEATINIAEPGRVFLCRSGKYAGHASVRAEAFKGGVQHDGPGTEDVEGRAVRKPLEADHPLLHPGRELAGHRPRGRLAAEPRADLPPQVHRPLLALLLLEGGDGDVPLPEAQVAAHRGATDPSQVLGALVARLVVVLLDLHRVQRQRLQRLRARAPFRARAVHPGRQDRDGPRGLRGEPRARCGGRTYAVEVFHALPGRGPGRRRPPLPLVFRGLRALPVGRRDLALVEGRGLLQQLLRGRRAAAARLNRVPPLAQGRPGARTGPYGRLPLPKQLLQYLALNVELALHVLQPDTRPVARDVELLAQGFADPLHE
mmetsp:Transcript_95536/g.270072  ORF Transcript_95536/g.270072 Transcript_95536/m.270072 type:complete len:358 (+) Transcript_95536:1010-2083(+)